MKILTTVNFKNILLTIIFVVNLGMLLAVVVVLLQLGNSIAIHLLHFENRISPSLIGHDHSCRTCVTISDWSEEM
jgi:hypothetical protein